MTTELQLNLLQSVSFKSLGPREQGQLQVNSLNPTVENMFSLCSEYLMHIPPFPLAGVYKYHPLPAKNQTTERQLCRAYVVRSEPSVIYIIRKPISSSVTAEDHLYEKAK